MSRFVTPDTKAGLRQFPRADRRRQGSFTTSCAKSTSGSAGGCEGDCWRRADGECPFLRRRPPGRRLQTNSDFSRLRSACRCVYMVMRPEKVSLRKASTRRPEQGAASFLTLRGRLRYPPEIPKPTPQFFSLNRLCLAVRLPLDGLHKKCFSPISLSLPRLCHSVIDCHPVDWFRRLA